MENDQRTLATTLGRFGVWSSGLRSDDPARRQEITDAAQALDELGYGAAWLGASPSVTHALPLLNATSRLTVATGILSIWEHEPSDVAEQYAGVNADHGGRFLLGLGVSHHALAERYQRPYSAMRAFLTGLDDAPSPVPAGGRVLAALGPRMLELARDRAAGAHPYLVTPEHTAQARDLLGDGPVLAPELKVVLDTDTDRARARARARDYLAMYLSLPNYTASLRRLGFAEEDFAGGGSDRLLDAVFAIGDAETIRVRADDFLDAGADHIALQVVSEDPRSDIPLGAWRALAEVLPLTPR